MRDLPMPGSPEISTAQPSPRLACPQRRRSNSISSSRPTSGVLAEVAKSEQVSQEPACGCRDDNGPRPAKPLEPSSKVRRVSDHRFFLRCTLADEVANHH